MALVQMRRNLALKLAPARWELPDSAPLIQELQHRALASNIVLEVRDARLPLGSAHKELYDRVLSWKHHLIVLNKADLVHPETIQAWKLYFHKRQQNYVFVNGHNKLSVKIMVRKVKFSILRALKAERTTLAMLAGLPNVGKSVLTNTLHRVGRYNISALEKMTLAAVGPSPYLTESIRGYKINYTPPMYILDTPSVMHPSITDAELGMNLAVIGAMDYDVVGIEQLVRYCLVLWNSSPHPFQEWWDEFRTLEFTTQPKDTHTGVEKSKMERSKYTVEVKGILSEIRLNYEGDPGNENEMEILVELQLREIWSFFQTTTTKPVSTFKTAKRVVGLFRSGRLGYVTLDALPETNEIGESQVDEPDIQLPPEVDVPVKKPYKRKRSLQNVSPQKLLRMARTQRKKMEKKRKPCKETYIH
ncbi:short integuments 2, mitochondrial-like [Selaginella moellendorffii]|uniref:short integuments 2, mitochondrial-like n=1 Tax=Selaginella moellendorffii TaxID=88036 RepID=UPI000D1CBAE2|nr:short integuments 2, mitochondrial-like [Selaginella moellendorffii]XP_024536493.1 short integuments 2, mitochondrial-like [Selaginella moellendorffii]XP_024536494.1 short integuments 2, mitochondrial-like [Selaginella moellendorffii]XP_024536495.1 short integuments 2, mitochondrial-like [Selaginella moellendorffii]|eukprot:XP_024536492.1 short integuments 2, mitochondrial-like [Selaginella moellendorffii]